MRRALLSIVIASGIIALNAYGESRPACNSQIQSEMVACTTGTTCEQSNAPCPTSATYNILSYYSICTMAGAQDTSYCLMVNFTGKEVCSNVYRCIPDPNNPNNCIKGTFVNSSYMDPDDQQATTGPCTKKRNGS